MKILIPAFVAIVAADATVAQVVVEFGPSGELMVMDPGDTTESQQEDLRAFKTQAPEALVYEADPPEVKLFELTETEEVTFDGDTPDEVGFDAAPTGEHTYALPARLPPATSVPKPVVVPEKPTEVAPPVVSAPPRVSPPSAPPPARVNVEPPKLETLLRVQSVHFPTITFETASAALQPASYQTLDGIAAAMQRDASLRVEIIGHTDSVGREVYNQGLSERRAAAVVFALVYEYGIAAHRLSSSGRGESEDIASNDTEWGRAQNRRVEVRRMD